MKRRDHTINATEVGPYLVVRCSCDAFHVVKLKAHSTAALRAAREHVQAHTNPHHAVRGPSAEEVWQAQRRKAARERPARQRARQHDNRHMQHGVRRS